MSVFSRTRVFQVSTCILCFDTGAPIDAYLQMQKAAIRLGLCQRPDGSLNGESYVFHMDAAFEDSKRLVLRDFLESGFLRAYRFWDVLGVRVLLLFFSMFGCRTQASG